MMKRLHTVLLLIAIVFAAHAHYSIHAVSGDVKVESGGKTVAATKGMSVKATDYLIISAGGKVDILNDLDKRIYSSIKSGKISVTRLMIDAKGVSSDNGANVASRMQLGRKQQKGDSKVYVEKGMVRRSLALYDPEGDNLSLDAVTLGKYLASKIKDGEDIKNYEAPVRITSGKLEKGGMGFRVENTLEFPVYFNVIKITGGATPEVEISQLGQPAGSYIILPQQALGREHYPKVDESERHILVLTNCQYDIDEVIEEIGKSLESGSTESGDRSDLPVFIKEL